MVRLNTGNYCFQLASFHLLQKGRLTTRLGPRRHICFLFFKICFYKGFYNSLPFREEQKRLFGPLALAPFALHNQATRHASAARGVRAARRGFGPSPYFAIEPSCPRGCLHKDVGGFPCCAPRPPPSRLPPPLVLRRNSGAHAFAGRCAHPPIRHRRERGV